MTASLPEPSDERPDRGGGGGRDRCRHAGPPLPTVRPSAGELAAAAVRDRVTHRAYLAELLAGEVDDREGRRRERRIAEARFPRTKRLAEFDLGATPSIEPAALAALATGGWISAGEPVVLLGDLSLIHI